MSTPTSFMVCTKCMTFNHHAYIEDAMNGFCMQETNFPFVCVIVDDASTDGEQEVIKKYFCLHFDQSETDETNDYVMTFGQHKTNKNCYFAILYLKYNHYSIKKSKVPYYSKWQDKCKYIALCEGDDYWIDSTKLQKQVEILENFENVTMVYSNYQTVDETKNNILRPIYEDYKKISKSGDILPTLFKRNFILTLTALFRKSVFETTLFLNAPSKMDYMCFLSAAFIGNAYYFNDEMGVYRNSPNGMINSHQNIVDNNVARIKVYVAGKYLEGHSKKESFMNDIVIKHWIMNNALQFQKKSGEKVVYNTIKIKKIMALYIFPSLLRMWFRELIKKGKKKLKTNNFVKTKF